MPLLWPYLPGPPPPAAGGGSSWGASAGDARYRLTGSSGALDPFTEDDLRPPPAPEAPAPAPAPAPPGDRAAYDALSLQCTALVAQVDTLQAENMRLRDELRRAQAQASREAEQVRRDTDAAVAAARDLAGERCEAAMSRLRLQAEALRKQNAQLSAQLSEQTSRAQDLRAQLRRQREEGARKLREERERLLAAADDQQRLFFSSLKTERDNLFEENELLKHEICLATGETREGLEEDLRRSLFSEGQEGLACLSRTQKARGARPPRPGLGASGAAGAGGGDGLAPMEGLVPYTPGPPDRAIRRYFGHFRSELVSVMSFLSRLDEQRAAFSQALSGLRETCSAMEKVGQSSATSAVFNEAMSQAERYRNELEEARTREDEDKKAIAQAKQERARLLRQIDGLTADLAAAKLGPGDEYAALVEQNTQLVSAKSDLEEKLSVAEDRISSLTMELMDATEQLEAERTRRGGPGPLSLRRSGSSDEVLVLSRKLEAATQQLQRAQRDLMQSRAEASRLQAEASQLRGRLALWGK